MTIFKKRDKQNGQDKKALTSEHEKKQHTVSVGSQFPNDTCRPVDYTDYPPFESYKEVLDESLDKLFEKEIDSGNADVLDNDIIQMAKEAKVDLFRQHANHVIAIDMMMKRRPGIRKEMELELFYRQEDLLKVQEEITAIKKKIDAYQAGGKC